MVPTNKGGEILYSRSTGTGLIHDVFDGLVGGLDCGVSRRVACAELGLDCVVLHTPHPRITSRRAHCVAFQFVSPSPVQPNPILSRHVVIGSIFGVGVVRTQFKLRQLLACFALLGWLVA
jgi:hypothetical protein